MPAPNPSQVAFVKQSARISNEMTRRQALRSKGIKTPLTRKELAAMAERGQTPQNGRRRINSVGRG